MIRKMLLRYMILVGVFATLLLPLPAAAANLPGQLNNSDCGNATDSTVCQSRGQTSNPLTGPNGMIVIATNIVALAGGIAAVIFMVIAGIRYITSQGDPSEISKAKQTIIYGLVGIVIIVIGREIISYVIGKI